MVLSRLLAVPLAVFVLNAAAAGFRLVSPDPHEVVHDNAGTVAVVVTGVPQGTLLQAMLDGRPHGAVRTAPAFELRGVDRGTHTLVVQRLDRMGRATQASEPVSFSVWQASRRFPKRRGP